MNERLNALAGEFSREVHGRVRRAFLMALGAGLLSAFALGASVVPIEISGNLLIAYGIFLAVSGSVLGLVLLRQFGGTFGDALAVVVWGRRHAEERWQRLGAGRIPRTPQEARAWLTAHPDPGSLQAQRLSAQIGAGDLPAARATLATYPTDTAGQRYELGSDAWFLDFLDGALPPVEPIAAAAAAVADEPEWAAVGVATLRAHAASVTGADWIAPLAAVRDRLGGRADGLVGARYVLPTWTLYMAAAAAMVGIALLLGRLTGIWG